ncbi:unnamed protein product [Citrullus colocynthis]|uniref:Uncharacterized protein n=1 Tax=Citrullus colocynthis TaxID=252529 RepID=A0ABP0YKF9_9ROSI
MEDLVGTGQKFLFIRTSVYHPVKMSCMRMQKTMILNVAIENIVASASTSVLDVDDNVTAPEILVVSVKMNEEYNVGDNPPVKDGDKSLGVESVELPTDPTICCCEVIVDADTIEAIHQMNDLPTVVSTEEVELNDDVLIRVLTKKKKEMKLEDIASPKRELSNQAQDCIEIMELLVKANMIRTVMNLEKLVYKLYQGKHVADLVHAESEDTKSVPHQVFMNSSFGRRVMHILVNESEDLGLLIQRSIERKTEV